MGELSKGQKEGVKEEIKTTAKNLFVEKSFFGEDNFLSSLF